MVLLDTETPGTSREIYSEDAEGKTRTHNPWITNPVLQPLSYAGTRSFTELYWYQEFLCPVELLYFSDEKSITVEK